MPFLSFANPSGLWFLPLAGLPLLIHLFRRRRAAVIHFPDLRLLQQVQNAAVRPNRVREYLLLAVRTLIILLLALSLAKPAVNLNLPGWLTGASQAGVIIMDNSASMAAVSRDTTLLARARHEALSFLGHLGTNSRIAVVSAVSGNPVVCGLSSPAAAAAAVAALPQTELGTDLEGAVQTAAGILESAGVSGGRIIVFSDLQRTAFGPGLAPLNQLPGGQVVTVSPLSLERPANNLVWRKVQIKQLIGKILIRAESANGFSPLIGLAAGGRILYQTEARPGKDGTITMSFGLPEDDSLYLFNSGDDLPLDDRYYLAPAGRPERDVLLISDESGTQPDYLYRALAAMDRAGYGVKKAVRLETQHYRGIDLMVIAKASIDGALKAGIIKSMHNGAALLVVPPLNSDRDQYQRLLDEFSDIKLTGLADSLPRSLYRLEKTGAGEGVLSDLSQAELEGIRIRTYWKALTRQPAELSVNRTDPVLIIGGVHGFKTAVLLAGCQSGFGELVFKPAFLVMLLQTADHLTQRTPRQSVTARALDGSGAQPGAGEKAGWARVSGGVMTAVNIPAEESELVPVSGPELEGLLKNISWNAQPSGIGTIASQNPAVRLFLCLAGLMLILEMFLRANSKK